MKLHPAIAIASLLTLAGAAAEPVPPKTTDAPYISAVLTDYGADARGERDSSEAFARVMTAAGTNRHIRISIPPGRYRLASRVLLTAVGNNSNYGLHIQGAGENVTELLVDNAEGGIAFVGKHLTRMSVIVSDLSLVAARNGAGTALSFDTANAGVQNDRQFTARDLTIRGEKFDRGHFNTAVHVRNAWFTLLHNIKVTQQYQPAIRDQAFNTEYNFLLEDCYSPSLTDCRALGGRYGLVHRVDKMKPDAPEDGIIRGCYFVGQAEGIAVDMKKDLVEWPEPGLHIDSCHVAYRDRGLNILGVQQANISHCLFYCLDRTGTPWHQPDGLPVPGGTKEKRRDYEPRDINLEFGANFVIDGNIFTEPANPNRVGIRIGPRSGHILISGNQFNVSGTAIKNESREPSYASGNTFGGKPDWSEGITPYSDAPHTLATRDFPPPARAPQTGGRP
ncbi:MAG: glycosyl hydrolase family 28-related protein [Kiritimatiellaeota bacterium]|nr:glycosyl hydrolase family 28-related protein [Kiritimatiellota bacterium]